MARANDVGGFADYVNGDTGCNVNIRYRDSTASGSSAWMTRPNLLNSWAVLLV